VKIRLLAATAAITLTLGGLAMAAMDSMVGGAAMYPSKNIVQNAVNSKDHTALVAAVLAAGLVPTLEGPGPFTVFAPTNEAFAALPAGTVQTLLKPANKPELTKILTYHVVPGRYTAPMLEQDVANTSGGRVSLKTVEGQPLIVSETDGNLMITDQQGDTADVTIPDVYQSNGVIMVVNKVLMP
jgi:uncharacterized surface protein with fasciclin (FAS1) repeats